MKSNTIYYFNNEDIIDPADRCFGEVGGTYEGYDYCKGVEEYSTMK